jgi:hypothetical protein
VVDTKIIFPQNKNIKNNKRVNKNYRALFLLKFGHDLYKKYAEKNHEDIR